MQGRGEDPDEGREAAAKGCGLRPEGGGYKPPSTEQLLGPFTPQTVTKANEDDLQFFNKCQEKAAGEELGKPLLGGLVSQKTKSAKFDAPRLGLRVCVSAQSPSEGTMTIRVPRPTPLLGAYPCTHR